VDEKSRIVRVEQEQPGQWIGSLLGSSARIAITNTCVWVRFSVNDETSRKLEAVLPGKRFKLVDGDWLVPNGCQVAEMKLPALDWKTPESLIELVAPTAAFTGKIVGEECPIARLVHGGNERPAAAGLFAIRDLIAWVETAPLVRLERLIYCVSDELYLVIGEPLPTIACQYLCQLGRVLWPAGMSWEPAVDVESIQDLFAVEDDQWLLWTNTDEWALISKSMLMPLRRSSIRAVCYTI